MFTVPPYNGVYFWKANSLFSFGNLCFQLVFLTTDSQERKDLFCQRRKCQELGWTNREVCIIVDVKISCSTRFIYLIISSTLGMWRNASFPKMDHRQNLWDTLEGKCKLKLAKILKFVTCPPLLNTHSRGSRLQHGCWCSPHIALWRCLLVPGW